MEKWIDQETVYKGDIFHINAGKIEADDGNIYRRQVVVNPGGVGVVPVIDNSILFVRQFRIAINQLVLEIPAGRLEPNEDPADSAVRELEEEVGFISKNPVLISEYFTAVGFSTEKMYIYLANDLIETRSKPEIDENLEVVKITIDNVAEMLKTNKFNDSKTIIGLNDALRQMGK